MQRTSTCPNTTQGIPAWRSLESINFVASVIACACLGLSLDILFLMSERLMSWSWDTASYTEILFQDVPRASRVQPEMFYETSTLAFSNIVSHWKLEFWMFLRSCSPRLVFMSFNPYWNAVSMLEEVVTNNKLSPKKNYTAVQLSIFFNFESECYQFILFQYDFLILYHPDENTTWQWKIQNLKMYFPLKNGDFPMSF